MLQSTTENLPDFISIPYQHNKDIYAILKSSDVKHDDDDIDSYIFFDTRNNEWGTFYSCDDDDFDSLCTREQFIEIVNRLTNSDVLTFDKKENTKPKKEPVTDIVVQELRIKKSDEDNVYYEKDKIMFYSEGSEKHQSFTPEKLKEKVRHLNRCIARHSKLKF